MLGKVGADGNKLQTRVLQEHLATVGTDTWTLRPPDQRTGNLGKDQGGSGQKLTRQLNFKEPGAARLVVRVSRPEGTDKDSRVYDDHTSRRCSRIAATASMSPTVIASIS